MGKFYILSSPPQDDSLYTSPRVSPEGALRPQAGVKPL